VPGQLIGREIKESLQFNWTNDLFSAIGYQSSLGTTDTAIGDSFKQFWYFGCLYFLFQGWFFRNIWFIALSQQSRMAQVMYIALLTPAVLGVTHGSQWFIQGALVIFLFLYATRKFCTIQ
jgi:cation transport ATPase